MNSKLLMIGGLVVAGAIGAFLLFRQNSAGPGTMGGGKETVSASFTDLIKMGKNYTCTFTTADQTSGSTTNGTVYVADQGTKMNGDFKATASSGTTTQTHIIRDGTYTYIWTGDEVKGFKMKIDPELESLWGTDSQTAQNQAAFDENQKMDFNCDPWTPQANLFVPPSTIEFMDMSAQLEMMKQYAQPTGITPSGNSAQCAACSQLTGDSKAQCLAALSC